MVFACVLLPICALVFRWDAGSQVIKSNHCTERFRKFQICSLGVVLLILLSIEVSMIVGNRLFRAGDERIGWPILAVIYLSNTLFAMYPGRTDTRGASILDPPAVPNNRLDAGSDVGQAVPD
jgi:hypothetical protein